MNQEIYTIKNISFENPRIINLELVRGDLSPVSNYRPGQYAMLAYKRNGVMTSWHPFTIASSPSDRRSLKFGIKTFGKFTQNLSKLKDGDTIYVKGPYGKFTFDENAYEKRVFIAGGIGVTPFLSAVKYANDNGFKNKMTLIYATYSLSDLAFVEDIKKLEKENENFTAHFVIKHKNEQELMPGRTQNGVLDKEMLYSILGGNITSNLFLLCGPPSFMKATKENLKKMGTPHKRIRFESFATNSMSIKANYKIFIPILSASAILLFFALNSISLAAEKKFIAKRDKNTPLISSPVSPENPNIINTLNEDIQDKEKIFTINDQIISRMTKLLAEKDARIIELNKERLDLVEKSGITYTLSSINENAQEAQTTQTTPVETTTRVRKIITTKPIAVPTPPALKTTPPPAPVVKAPLPAPTPAPTPTPTPRTTVS